MKQYNHLFFDLDHTLWDFERNSAESLTDIYHAYNLASHGVLSLGDFVRTFISINTKLWDEFDQGKITHSYIREHRFRIVFEQLGIQPLTFNDNLGEEYLKLLPQKTHLLDGAIDLLEYLSDKGYHLHIVSNGFDFIQTRKMQSANIYHFFKHIITNEKAGAKKPDAQIFRYATNAANATHQESLMIGDNWIADIEGALNFGIDAAFYNPNGLIFGRTPTYDIKHLNELKLIL